MVGQTELFWQDQEHIQRQIQQAKQLKKEQQFSLSNTTNRLDKKTSE
jgi:hypothetical protein